jgi:dynein heavy chain
MRVLDKDLRTWEAYIYTEMLIKNLLTSLYVITELQNPAIRERHWIELMVATKVIILTTSPNFRQKNYLLQK